MAALGNTVKEAKMKTVLLAATLVGALIAAGQADAKTKHNPIQQEQVVTAQPGDGGYHQASGFEIVEAQCELIANQLQPSTFAFGVGPMLGTAIRSQITHAQNYDNCMTLKGYAKN